MESKWWYDPCDEKSYIDTPDPKNFRDWDLSELFITVEYNLKHSNEIKNEWALKTFQKDFDDVLFVGLISSWLPRIPKEYNKRVDVKRVFRKLPTESLGEFYSHFQTYAVGIQELACDEERNKTGRMFQYMRVYLKKLLCKMKKFMTSYRIPLPCDVPPQIMPAHLRGIPSTRKERDMNDFIIIKEYINCLQYFEQTLRHFSDIQNLEDNNIRVIDRVIDY